MFLPTCPRENIHSYQILKTLEDYFINLKGSGLRNTPIRLAGWIFRQFPTRQHTSNSILDPCGGPLLLDNRLPCPLMTSVRIYHVFLSTSAVLDSFCGLFLSPGSSVSVLTVQEDVSQSLCCLGPDLAPGIQRPFPVTQASYTGTASKQTSTATAGVLTPTCSSHSYLGIIYSLISITQLH